MMRRLSWLRRYPLLLLAVPLFVVLGLVIALASSGRNHAPDASALATLTAPTPVSTQTADQEAVNLVVNRFVNALDVGDADALYALQTDAYKQTCSRQDFATVAQSLKTSKLAGPVTAAIQGDRASARLFVASGEAATLSLERAVDGTWRVVAAVSGRCS